MPSKDLTKISSSLMLAMNEIDDSPQFSTSSKKSLGVLNHSERTGKATAVVFFDVKKDAKSEYFEQKYNCRMNEASGTLRTGVVAIDEVDALSQDDNINRIVLSKKLRPVLDVSIPAVKVNAFKKSDPTLTGAGVIVGIIDTGLDTKHPAFPASRIISIWDQTVPGNGVKEGKYGKELIGAAVTNGTTNDVEGHGTHVAGIAAGSDSSVYQGLAPESQLVIVKSDFQTAGIADGVRYIFRIAKEKNLPAVINMSLGGHFDAHDGSDPLSKIVTQESGPGRIVCCAAGNEGSDNIFASMSGAKGVQSSARFVIPAGESALLNGWYSGSDEFEIAVESPSGKRTPFQSIAKGGQNPVQKYSLTEGSVRIVTADTNPDNGDHNFLVEVTPKASPSPISSRIWKLWINGKKVGSSGRVDVWSITGAGESVFFTGQSVKNEMKIGSPGCAVEAITVAAYTTRNQWTDNDGNSQGAGLALNDIADFSSPGPLRSKVLKPDVAAPGAMIISAKSAQYDAGAEDIVDDQHVIMAGTSMAAPFITGLVALLLQRDRNLDHNQVKAILQSISRVPNRNPNTHDIKWGFGLIDFSKLDAATLQIKTQVP